jgi:hypothetical protein
MPLVANHIIINPHPAPNNLRVLGATRAGGSIPDGKRLVATFLVELPAFPGF